MCTCLTISIPYVDFQSGVNDLYLTYTNCNGTVVSDSYLNLQHAIVRDGNSIAAEVYVCIQNSTNVTFKYGSGGSTVTLPNVVITQNGTCTDDEDCVPQCECLVVTISQDDIDRSLNNTLYPNGTVFLYIEGSMLCDGDVTTPDFEVPINNADDFYYCTKHLSTPHDPTEINIFYYANDIKYSLGDVRVSSSYSVPGTYCNEDIGCVPSSGIEINDCDPLLGEYKSLTNSSWLYSYDPTTNDLTELTFPPVYNSNRSGGDIHSNTKLWGYESYVGPMGAQYYGINEYDIILNPWTIRFNRYIEVPYFIPIPNSGGQNWYITEIVGYQSNPPLLQSERLVGYGYLSTAYNGAPRTDYIMYIDISGSVASYYGFQVLPNPQNLGFNQISSVMITEANQFIYTQPQNCGNSNVPSAPCGILEGLVIQDPTPTIGSAGGPVFPANNISSFTGVFQKNNQVYFTDSTGNRSYWNPYLQQSIAPNGIITPPNFPSVWTSVSTLQECNPEDLLPDPIICGFGNTTPGYNYYYDCCGSFVEILNGSSGSAVRYDYTKPSQGITPQYLPASTTCPTSTPTPTPTPTPTITPTPTLTPTPTITPTITPTPSKTPSVSQFVTLKNDCDTFTLFDMGLRCNIEFIPSSTSSDGILSVLVTGGTSPYSFYWAGGQRTQRLVDVPQGSYEVTVVDYYGDYTATTVCNLIPPSQTPTQTPTSTPTPTPTPVYPNLCLIYQDSNISYGPIQFIINGAQNGKPTWVATYNSTQLNVIWSIQNSRWEISNWTLTSSGIPVSTNQTNIPDSLWSMAGGQNAAVTMIQGACPPYIPLINNVTKQDSTCNLSNNGSIVVNTNYGEPDYFYSIDGGNTYQSSNVFQNLAPGQYSIITKDSDTPENILNNQVTIGVVNQNTNYTIGVVVENITNVTSNTQICNWKVDVNPPLPNGISISFGLNVNNTKDYYGPGSGIISGQTIVKKDNVIINPTIGIPTTTINPRPNCSPYEVTGITRTDTYQVTIGSGESVSGTSTSILNITNNQIGPNACITKLTQQILINTVSPTITGGVCYNIINQPQSQGINNHSLNFSAQPNA